MKKIVIVISCCIINYFFTFIAEEQEHNKQAYEYRYQILKPLLNKYKRPITVLELGASNYALSFDIAQQYNATCVIIATNNTQQLLGTCTSCKYDNVILLNKQLLVQDLIRLGECEHFDVVLAFDTTQLFHEEWKKVTDTLLKLGDHIILESPAEHKKNHIEHYLINNKETVAVKTLQHNNYQTGTVFLCSTNRQYFARNYWNYSKLNRPGTYIIKSNFKEKSFIKKGPITTKWHSGINLLTFKVLQGIYPSKETIRSLLEPLQYAGHSDLNIHNVIIQGKKLALIDWDGRGHFTPQEAFARLMNHFK